MSMVKGMPKYNTRIRSLIMVLVALSMLALGAYTLHAENQMPQIIGSGPVIAITAGVPLWNPFTPGNVLGAVWTYMPLAAYNAISGQFWPILAQNWTLQTFPNGSALLTIYLRPGLYWYNGSATIPFTAWDVYAYFYIEAKAFKTYTAWMNYSLIDEDIKVLNNYTIQFLFQKWTPYLLNTILTTYVYTPWPVWSWAVNALKGMNMTEAYNFGQNNITRFNAPYWALSPWYNSYFGPTGLSFTLLPPNLLEAWGQVFPFNAWMYYNPTIKEIGTTSNTQTLEYIMAGEIDYTGAVLSEAQIGIVNKTSGWSTLTIPAYNTIGFVINPHYYPWDIPQVREALCYVINRTEVAASWGLSLARPDYYPQPIVPETIATFPPDVRQFIIPCSYDPAKASQILQSLGFYKKGGYWYTPNGTQLALTVIAPAGWTDWDTMAQDAVEQLDAFGINAKLLTIDVGTFWSVTLPNAEYEALINGIANAPSYSTMWIWTNWPWWEEGRAISAGVSGSDAWPFQWPNGTCSPVIVPTTPNIPNGTIVWCVNSTFGYINLTNWQSFVTQYSPGEPEYDLALEVIFAWMHYFVPIVPLYDKYWPFEYSTSIMDPGWLFQGYVYDNYPGLLAVFLEYQPWGYGNQPFSVNTWGLFAPKGIVPPVAQAIANGSIWTKYPQYAAFLGIPTPDPMLQEAVASYFHIPYTPVTTTTSTTTTTTTTTTPVTTTSTTTSTITTTATTTTTAVSTVTSTATVTSTVTTTSTTTTTAVSTVTVTKPVISTALVIGIVVIVIVIAAVAAIIALRRR